MVAGRLGWMHLEQADPSGWSLVPFGLLLGAMALAPVWIPGWWARHYAKVALGLGAITVIYYLAGRHALAPVTHVAHEYVSFVVLIGGLFVIAGGIHLIIKGEGTPLRNAGFLLAGAVLANVLGTTGAAMLLIRPWMRFNQARLRAYHIVFFIFIVANVGGCLTPVGDPPLFLGYLQGVPFWWVARHCWPIWAVGVGLLLGIFYGVDLYHVCRVRREGKSKDAGTDLPHPEPQWRLEGGTNFLFLALFLGAVFINGSGLLREGLMILAAGGSWLTTKKSVRAANEFDFHLLREVAILFAGIFATMMPALDWLQFHAAEVLGSAPSPGMFFWGTGLLSSVLDNAPTYLSFFSSLKGVTGISDTMTLLQSHAARVMGMSMGAVFFGAATYIGNGPNLMIKSMAARAKIPMPSFGGFLGRFSLPCLLPVLFTVWLLFFRR